MHKYILPLINYFKAFPFNKVAELRPPFENETTELSDHLREDTDIISFKTYKK